MKSDEPLERVKSVGKIVDHIEVILVPVLELSKHAKRVYELTFQAKIVDNEGNIVPLNTKGELYVRGHCVMLGYYHDIEKTNEAIGPDRWYKTG